MGSMSIPTNLQLIDADQLSFSFWCKIFQDDQVLCGTNNYSCTIIANDTQAGLIFLYKQNSSNYVVAIQMLLEHNTWYHCCFTFNKGVSKWYINGEEQILATNTLNISTLNMENFQIGDIDQSSTNESTAPLISDFRIYVTALTEEDVKELYQTTMTIDNNNNLYARELTNDVIEGISATRQGLLRAEHFNETSTTKFNKDKTVESNYFYEY